MRDLCNNESTATPDGNIPDTPAVVTRFIDYITCERRLSTHTVCAYRTDLKQFIQYLRRDWASCQLEQADCKPLRAWIVDLASQELSNRSINRKIASLKAFYAFLQVQGDRNTNPADRLKMLKVQKSLPTFVRSNELITLLDHHTFPDTFQGWRDKLILELLYGTGIRLAELLHLRDADIHSHDHTLKVLGKGNRERIVPFPKQLMGIIEAYRTHRDRVIPHTQPFLLVRNNGGPAYPTMVYKIVQKYLRTYTHADKQSPHVLRHTFATHLMHNGADLHAVKELLGHKSLAATQLYTHSSLRELKQVFTQAHPRA